MSRMSNVQSFAATVCLPAALASVLVGIFPSPGAAASPPDLHSAIEAASHDATVTLRLVNGTSVAGAFAGFLGDWGDTVPSALRYESWRQPRPEGLPRWGESVFLTLDSGDTLRGSFAGVGPTFLALARGHTPYASLVSFSAVREARSDTGGSILSWADLQRRLAAAPLLAAVGLRHADTTVVVPRESIASTRGYEQGDVIGKGVPVVLIVLALVGAGALAAACCSDARGSAQQGANSSISGLSSCTSGAGWLGGSDRRFGTSSVSTGLGPWPPGETRRP